MAKYADKCGEWEGTIRSTIGTWVQLMGATGVLDPLAHAPAWQVRGHALAQHQSSSPAEPPAPRTAHFQDDPAGALRETATGSAMSDAK